MRPRDIFLFLIGDRGAIERVAGCRWALLVGAVLVLSAGIARNWDAVYLLRHVERWVLGPFGMSLFSATFLFAFAVLRLGNLKTRDWEPQFAFLRLFWMTAPCAWLYAIPVEQWTDPLTAAQWNVGFLVAVSLWRVALITRALSVLTEVPFLRVLVVLLPAAAFEMFAASLFQVTLHAATTMGGVRDLPPEDAFVDAATDIVGIVSLCAFVGVGAASLTVLKDRRALRPLTRDPLPFPAAALAVATGILAVGAVGSLPMQRRTGNEDVFHQLVAAERFDEAVRFASSLHPRDFPRRRLRVPRRFSSTGYAEERKTLSLLEHLPADPPVWLRDDWEHVVTQSLLTQNFKLAGRLERVFRKHPRIVPALRARADDYRAREGTLAGYERFWLDRFDEVEKEVTKGAKRPDPSPEPVPRKR